MKINFPKIIRWNGREIPVEGAMERALKTEGKVPAQEPEENQVPRGNAPNLKGYLFVPTISIYVAKERTLPNLTWAKTHEELKKQNLFMPTPYQFREFLKYVRDSKNSEHQKIFKDVVEVRDPWRAQWLNARFEKRKNGLYMISENVLVNGSYQNQEQKLDDYLNKDKIPGISLDDWLNSNAPHGLPASKTKDGSLYFWAPVEGYVARFDAGSDRAVLYCYRDPGVSYASLGVRACAEGTVAKKSRR